MPAKKIVAFFTSLRLTVVLLAFAIILVFIGTLAQVDEGLYQAQARYFRQWFIFGLDLFGHKIPLILPGGYLIGTLLLANLIFAHACRFQLSVKKIGIQFAHLGVIVLLIGQLATDMFSHETQMRFHEGQTKSFSESGRDYELVFRNGDVEIAIPQNLLAQGGALQISNLPFTVTVKSFWKNSEPSFRAPMMTNLPPPVTTNGIAANFDFRHLAEVKTTDDKNVPTALIEISSARGSLGDWVISGWSGDETMLGALERSYSQQIGAQFAQKITTDLAQPQIITIDGKSYTFILRPTRLYLPFSLTLLQATNSFYPGTDTPKDFRSRVLLNNLNTGEKREVEIYMNSPLRYAGLTFYQYQMDAGEAAAQAGRAPTSVLQVVRNPGWLTPYFGCALVALGLVIQFMFHLVGFISKRRAA